MKRSTLQIVGGIAGVVVAVVAAVVIVVASIDPNAHKELIAEKFRDATGRELTLAGDIGLTLYPWLGLTLNNAGIANAEGFSDTDFLQVGHAEVRIKLLPLLGGDYEIDTVRLDGVNLSLEVAANGINNWTFAGNGDNTVAASDNSNEAGIGKMMLGGVDIRNTSIVYDDRSANAHYEIRNVGMQIGTLVYGEPLDVTLNLQALSQQPQLRGDLALKGTVLYDIENGVYQLDPLQLTSTLNGPTVPGGSTTMTLQSSFSMNTKADTLTVPSLQLSALGATVSGNLDVRGLSAERPSVKAGLNASGTDMAALFRILDQNELASRIQRLDSRFNISASIDADMDTGIVAVPALDATLLGATIHGVFDATNANTDEPVVSGQLQALGPDLPTLVEVLGILQGGSGSSLARTGRDLAQVSDKNFSLQTEFTADLGAGNMQLPALTANLLGFRLSGALNAEAISDGGTIAGNLSMQSGNLREVLRALKQDGLADVAQSLTLDVQLGGTGDNLRISPLNLSLVVAGGQLGTTPQTLALNADTAINLKNDSLAVDSFTLNGLGLDLGGAVKATQLSTDLRYEGNISLPAFNARDFLRKLNLDAPQTADASVLQNVSIAAGFSGSTNSFALQSLALGLDDTLINGSVNLSDLSNMAGTFDINIDAINADRYLALPSDSPAAATSDASPLPNEDLRKLNVQGQLAIGQLTISGLKMTDIKVPLSAKAGVIALAPLQAKLYEGSFNGNLGLNVAGPEAIASVATTLSAINLAPLLKDFMDANYLSGHGTIELTLEGRGNDSTAIKQNLNGAGKLALTDGVLSGVDVGATLNTLETMIRSKQLVDLPQGGQTAFDNFSATLAIDNGVVASNDLLVKAPGWQLAGAGTLADLRRDIISFNLIATTDAGTATVAEQQYDIGGHQLPIACSGALNSPRCLPDAKAIIASAVSNVLQDRIGNFLQQRLGGQQQPATDATAADPAAPATDTTAPATGQPAAEQPAAEPTASPEQELLNRALNRLLR